MKNKKSIILALVAVLLFSFATIGCGQKASPKECAQVLWDIKLKGDISNVKKIGGSEEEGKKLLEASRSGEIQLIKSNMTKSGLNVTDDQLNSVYDAFMEASAKNTVTIEEVSKSGDTAEVKITCTYIDEPGIDQKAANDALSQVKSTGATTKKELIEKLTDPYINNLVDDLKNAEISSDTVDKTFTFKKDKNGVWAPEDKNAFIQAIAKMATNQK